MKNLRKRGPAIQRIDHVSLPPFKSFTLDNGLEVYSISQGTQEILKIEIVFKAGRPYEHKKVVSRACNNQIKEGSASMNSREIVEAVDFYGASLRTGENLDTCSISLFCLTKHFKQLMPILQEVVMTPQFPEDELRKYIETNSERLKIELVKNDVIAYRKITESIFSTQHPYGYNSEIADYQKLRQSDLKGHYDRNYGVNNCQIFLSGKVTDEHLKLCNTYFGNGFRKVEAKESIPNYIPTPPANFVIPSDQDVQTAIKIGKRLFKRSHEDYPGMYILNAVLGGYFGSRLMSNIREEKGYTYNIYSEVDVMKHDGLFLIGTEVGAEYADPTIQEIYKELGILRDEEIDREELEMVQNYLLGRILNFIDGPFNSGRLLKSIILSDLDENYFNRLVHKIKTITASELQELANRYLVDEDMWVVRVG